MTVENAITWLRLNKLPDIVVFRHGGKSPCFAYQVDAGTEPDIEDTVSYFQQNIELLGAGRYRIEAKKNKNTGSGVREFLFAAGVDPEPARPASAPGGIIGIDRYERLQEEKWESRVEALMLRMQLSQSEAKVASLQAQVAEKTSPNAHVAQVVSLFAREAVQEYARWKGSGDAQEEERAVAGTGEVTDQYLTDLVASVAEGMETDDFVLLLTRLAGIPPAKRRALAHVNDEKLNLALNFL